MKPRANLPALFWTVSAIVVDAPDTRAQTSFDSISARIDPWVAKPRVLVLTDIATEPDDQMSMVRFLVYSNQYDVEGLVPTTSTWMRRRHHDSSAGEHSPGTTVRPRQSRPSRD